MELSQQCSPHPLAEYGGKKRGEGTGREAVKGKGKQWRIQGGGNPAMPFPNPARAPIQSDSLAINLEFNIIRQIYTLWSIDSQESG